MNNSANPGTSLDPRIDRAQRVALFGGVAALVICAIAGFFSPNQFFQSYLVDRKSVV